MYLRVPGRWRGGFLTFLQFMNLSKANKALIEAYDRGYRVDHSDKGGDASQFDLIQRAYELIMD